MNKFGTDISGCPISSYQASYNDSYLSQPGCLSPFNSSNCRGLQIDTDYVENYTVSFKVTAVGGTTDNVSVNLTTPCSDAVKIV